MQFAMLKIQCTIHSGLRMPGYQSADVYLWSEDPGSHKHDPSCLGGPEVVQRWRLMLA